MKTGAVVVEFLGLPGAGKSELSQSVARDLLRRSIVAQQPSRVLAHGIGPLARRLRKSAHVLWECFSHPFASVRAASAIAGTGQHSVTVYFKLAFNWLLVVALARRAHRKPGVHLFDEGVLQAVWSVGLEGNEEQALTLLRRCVPTRLPGLVVVVDASTDVVTQRLRTRPESDSRLDRQPGRTRELLARGDHLLHRIQMTLGEIAKRTRFVSVRNETTSDLALRSGEIAALIAETDFDANRSAPPESQTTNILRWLTWSSIGLGITGVGQFAVLAVLARYLSPAEFGVVTATLIVISLGRAFTNDAVGPALVQRDDLQPSHIRSAAALSLLAALGMVLVLWLAAPMVARFFHMPDIAGVMRTLSVLFLCQAPGLVPAALLHRQMQMRALALAEGYGMLLGYVPFGIGLGMSGFGIWSLVAAHIGQAVVKSVFLLVARPHPMALWPELRPTRDLIRFSSGFVTGNLFSFGASQGDHFVVGRWMTAAALGIYGRAYQLMWMPAMFLGEVIDRVLFPLMARSQHDKEMLRLVYGRCVSLVAMTMTPVAAAGIVLAEEIVRVVLGAGWHEVVLPFQILMTGLVFRTGYKISDSLSRATGTVYSRAWRQAIFAMCIGVGAVVGTEWGVPGVSAGIVVALGANYVLMAGLSILTTGLGWVSFLVLHLRGLLIGVAFGGLTFLARDELRDMDALPFTVLTVAPALAGAILVAAALAAPRALLGADGLRLMSQIASRGRA